MVKNILKYPQAPSVEFNAPVRKFDENLFELIEDLKDTIKKNNLKALSAYQIGNPYSVIVYKNDNDELIELINARVFSKKDKITTLETTQYFGDLEASIQRDKYIKIIYEDKNQNQKFLEFENEEAVLIQRKIDYNFGSTFIARLDLNEKNKFEQKLQYGSNIAIPESCPIVSYKDYILKFSNLLLLSIAFLFVVSFIFSEEKEKIWDYQLYISYITLLSTSIYIIYGQYEGKKYSSCTSCQIGNLLGTSFILFIRLSVVMILSYFMHIF